MRRPAVPSRARLVVGRFFAHVLRFGIGDQLPVEDIREASFEAAQGFHGALAGSELAAVVGATFGLVAVARDEYGAVELAQASDPAMDIETYIARKSRVLQRVLAESDLTPEERLQVLRLNDLDLTGLRPDVPRSAGAFGAQTRYVAGGMAASDSATLASWWSRTTNSSAPAS